MNLGPRQLKLPNIYIIEQKFNKFVHFKVNLGDGALTILYAKK